MASDNSSPPLIQAQAPGKIILSGEHAVVHGRPALVTAVDRGITCSLWESDDDTFHIELPSLGKACSLSVHELEALRTGARSRYDAFLEGRLAIQDVVPDPVDLLACAVAESIAESSGAIRVRIDSELPLGAGMGSSAAALASILLAVQSYEGTTPDRDTIFQQTLALEQLQHGHPSGVDPAVCVHGGLIMYRPSQGAGGRRSVDADDDGHRRQEPAALQPSMDAVSGVPPPGTLIFTGRPESTTGECVESVRQRFGGHSIWNDFERVTMQLANCLTTNDASGWLAGIRDNQWLLAEIGVVPRKLIPFIMAVEAAGGAAKVCGAGSIRGDAAGMVMAYGCEDIDRLCSDAGYEPFSVQGGAAGVDLI